MKLNHLNLCTSDVAALGGIFVRHFAFEAMQSSADFALLRGNDNFSLVLMRIGADSPKAYPTSFHVGAGFHIGFIVETPAQVHAKHEALRQDGCRPGAIKMFEAIGSTWTTFYCPVGDGIDIEVTARI